MISTLITLLLVHEYSKLKIYCIFCCAKRILTDEIANLMKLKNFGFFSSKSEL